MLRVLIVLALVCLAAMCARAAETPIRMNTLGFLPDRPKCASIAAACSEFMVVRADGEVAFRGKATGPRLNADTGESLYTADFSALTTPGTYRLEIPDVGQSAPFRIATDVYAVPLIMAIRGMYLWRCGTAVSGTYNGVTYTHNACHTEDAWLDYVGGGHVKKPSLKGWHDAGDYNKYVVNAGYTVGMLFRAWEQFGAHLGKLRLNLPEAGDGCPEFLSEVKWELDWLLTMQAPDGSVYHKVSTLNFGPSGPPERETTDRFFAPWSSAATADFVAMMAAAGRLYQPYDRAYARRCLEAAKQSYQFLAAHPENHPADLSAFHTGGYQTGDKDDRLWAAAELWETTGEAPYLADFETRARGFEAKIDVDYGWDNVKNLGMLTYLLSKRSGRDKSLVDQVRTALLTVADTIAHTAAAHGYARPLGNVYYWGCNGGVAGQTLMLLTANQVAPKADYVNTALDAVGHLFGRNVYGRSFVTGLGANPPQHPHDRRSMEQPGAPIWPGYLVGGGWPKATSWQDIGSNYETNEIAINWNASLIYALAGLSQQ